MVHFRRPSDYQGKYGFDWLRDEYIYPIESIGSTPTALCKDIAKIKIQYKTTDVLDPIAPYGEEYYPAWLSIFPSTTTKQFPHGSSIHQYGVSLDLEIEELEGLSKDATKIIFETSDKNLIIFPESIPLKNLLGKKETKSLGSSNRDYYLSKKVVNIKNTKAPLSKHEQIKVFAECGNKKEEVGKLMVYQNNIIPKAEIVAVNVRYQSKSTPFRNDYHYLFKRQSFNQALIRADVVVDTIFDLDKIIRDYPTDSDVISLQSNFITPSQDQVDADTKDIQFHKDIMAVYEKYGKHRPSGDIDGSQNRTYLFYTNILASDAGLITYGLCSLEDSTKIWGNSYIIYQTGLYDKYTVIHEAGHSFSLWHTFSSHSTHEFHQGTTDNIMDYTQKADNSAGPYQAEKLNNYFKWQWDIMRGDRSLITSY